MATQHVCGSARGIDINASDENGDSSDPCGVFRLRIEAASMRLRPAARGVDVNASGSSGETALNPGG